jgi:hypothetical protein
LPIQDSEVLPVRTARRVSAEEPVHELVPAKPANPEAVGREEMSMSDALEAIRS